MSKEIPIQNIYYLLCYAWNRLEEGELVDVSSLDSTETVDLFAAVLVNGVNHLLRRGLSKDYAARSEILSTIQGRVDITQSSRRFLLHHGKAMCNFDVLTVDTLENRVIKATLVNLSRQSRLDPILKGKVDVLCHELNAVSDTSLSRHTFRRIQLNGNLRFYRFLLSVCHIIYDNSLIDEASGQSKFRDFIRDERRMSLLFEKFVFNFIRHHRVDLAVTKEKITWDTDSDTSSEISFLPKMETDISVRSGETTLVIDTKYYTRTLSEYFESKSIHSSNLYQIFSYLKNMEQRVGPDRTASGMLLYPKTDEDVDLSYSIQGHRLDIKTLDLSKPWQSIEREIHSILDDHFKKNESTTHRLAEIG